MAIKPVNGYDRIAKFISSKPVQSVVRFADKNPALFQSATVFTAASVLRPATIMGTPAKTKERHTDNLYRFTFRTSETFHAGGKNCVGREGIREA